MPLNYDAINALARKKYIPKLTDNFFKSHALLALMMKGDRYKQFDGHTIVEPLIYGELSGVKSYRGYDTVTYDQNIPITAAEFPIKHLVAPISIAESEDIETSGSGDVAVKNLIQSKFEIAELSLKKQFAAQLYADGTGNSGKDITGLGAVIATTGTYGGIDRATYTWWRAIIHSNSGQVRPLTTRLLRKLFITLSDGPDQPDLIILTDALWNRLAELHEGKIRITTKDSVYLADMGFQVLEFMGKPVVADKDAPAGTIMVLNTKYLKLRYSPAANFRTTKWRRESGAHFIGQIQEILWSGNLTCSNCSKQGKLTDLDEAGY